MISPVSSRIASIVPGSSRLLRGSSRLSSPCHAGVFRPLGVVAVLIVCGAELLVLKAIFPVASLAFEDTERIKPFLSERATM